ncbi:cysteine desulfurase-like protein [Nocardioides cynanchi]|uniref:cysteine desulfurase-like protein n=1 Tax=Nocardioides cynanchi TaxID=2558918 RepID=UPI001243A27A|nr:cysteine desulfurase-like protein [Nocardioides cynanchi]
MTSSTTYDVEAVRAHFPALAGGTAYFDGPGGSQTPDVVAQAIYDVMTGPLSNQGANTPAERNAAATVDGARRALGDLLGADPSGIVFGRSMTQLTMDLARTMAKDWGPGDEVVVTRLDHDGNVRPWVIAAEAVGATVRWADFDPATAELDPAVIGDLLSDRTRLVAVTAASNLLGTMPDIRGIADLVHRTDALLYVDGVHYTPHAFVDVTALGADFYACSPYKFLGPHCGVVAGRFELLENLRPDKLAPSSDQVPERFELGTLPYELMAGTTAAIDFLASLVPGGGSRRSGLEVSLAAVGAHEARLGTRVEEALAALPGTTLWSRAARRTPTLLATFDGHAVADVYAHLGRNGVNAPAGTFYAYEAARLLGLDEGGLRIGLAAYTSDADVDRLLDVLTDYVTR